MADEAVITPDAEVNAPETETTVETTPEVANEQTIGDMVEETQPESKPKNQLVERYLNEKKLRKSAERELEELRALVESDSSQEEIDEGVADFTEKYDINPEFVNDWEARMEKKFEARFGQKEQENKFEDKFSKAFNEALERGPEFKAIANTEVIKTLAKLPQNSRKTVSQLLEETYGNALTGKRTIETTTPGGGKDPEPLDLKRAEQDIEYYKQVMADPKKKAQYNAHMLARG